MENIEPTKRNLVSITARFFDPLGIISPITVSFKMLCQHLCRANQQWHEVFTGELLHEWNKLLQIMKLAGLITVPRCALTQQLEYSLVGFCDASAKAYAAVVYLRTEQETHADTHISRLQSLCRASGRYNHSKVGATLSTTLLIHWRQSVTLIQWQLYTE